MQHLKKIPRTSVIQIWSKIWTFVYQSFEKNRSLWFSPQNFLKFLWNSVHFVDSHSRYAQNDSFALGLTSFFKKSGSLRKFWLFPEKWQPISWAAGVSQPSPLHLLGLKSNKKGKKWKNHNLYSDKQFKKSRVF